MAKFSLVEDDDKTPSQSRAEQAGIAALTLGLSALSQRAVIALSRLFVLLATASAFALWWSVLPNPTVLQLVGLGMYAAFVLAASVIVRRL
jgi:hypothetical protein